MKRRSTPSGSLVDDAVIDVTPIKNRIARLAARRAPDFRDVSDRSWQLSPAETTTSPPAVFLDADLERVTGVQEVTTLDNEMRRIRGGASEHRASVAHRLRDVRLLDGHLYRGTMKHRVSVERGRLAAFGAPDVVESATLASSLYGNLYFGHFLRDDLTMQLAAVDIAPPVTTSRAPYSHEADYRRLLELPANALSHAHFRELIVLDDVGQNRFKRERYQAMRAKLKRSVTSTTRVAGAYIRRGRTGVARLLQNEDAVEALLVRYGFVVVDPSAMSVDAMVAKMAGAPIVVTVEGSQAAHGYFAMQDGGSVLVLQPPFRFNNVIKDFTDCVGMTYAFVVGRPAPEDGFVVDLDGLASVLEKLANRPERASNGIVSEPASALTA